MRCPWRDQSDESFARDCRWEAFRGPGPGGQKRNKTSSAVRAVHLATGITSIATERRSQSQNRQVALRRLRHRLTLQIRQPVKQPFKRPAWFGELVESTGRLAVGERDARYLSVLGFVLDVFEDRGWAVAEAAKLLGISSGALSGFLERDEHAWRYVNEMRGKIGLKSLK